MPVELYLFDVLEIEGEDLTGLPYDTRRARLAELGVEAWRRVSAPQAFTDIAPAQGLDVARAHRLEGSPRSGARPATSRGAGPGRG